jgi:hypothetical protein
MLVLLYWKVLTDGELKLVFCEANDEAQSLAVWRVDSVGEKVTRPTPVSSCQRQSTAAQRVRGSRL